MFALFTAQPKSQSSRLGAASLILVLASTILGLSARVMVAAQTPPLVEPTPRKVQSTPLPPGAAIPPADPKADPDNHQRSIAFENLDNVPVASTDIVNDATPHVEWTRIMASQRIGGRLQSVSVDPTNANRVFVGTEEGTILRSLDGGVTWNEYEITPFSKTRRSIGPMPPPKPSVGVSGIENFQIFIDPPNSRFLNRIGVGMPTEFMSRGPEFMRYLIGPSPPVWPETFLEDVVKNRGDATFGVWRIAICPGGEFPLIASVKQELYASRDDGVTWLRLFNVIAPAIIRQVHCNPDNPNDITIATSLGGYRSNDGGYTWNHLTLGRGEAMVTTAVYAKPFEGDKTRLVVFAYDFGYQGDPDKQAHRLTFIYPNMSEPETAPWEGVWWVDASRKNNYIWTATDDGVRLSRNNGANWEVSGRQYFSGVKLFQVMIGTNESGGERVAVLASSNLNNNNWVYATDDYGKNWYPFFIGQTRRMLRQMAVAPAVTGQPPRWWLVTEGELFATVPARSTTPEFIDRVAQRWAQRELDLTPPLASVVQACLGETNIEWGQKIKKVVTDARGRHWIPRVDMEFSLFSSDNLVRAIQTGSDTYELGVAKNQTNFGFFVQAMWETPKFTVQTPLEPSEVVPQLQNLRRYESFVVEDTWSERRMVLRKLTEGIEDPLQVVILKERVKALDAVLEVWLGRSLKRFYFELKRKEREGESNAS